MKPLLVHPAQPGPSFDYDQAFSRNLGWFTEAEQAQLRGKKAAIAGMGGVGGAHLLTLARLGIGAFHIADFDQFDLPNMNRQAGAMHPPWVETRRKSCRPWPGILILSCR
ncbi:hypothetical protein UNDKW_1233 [Undibacterium sp. KW1]|uniref:ThiF family adenylyltransferase n=1 Tax=Undibacterium sp. KW1 TaxID=2058624 RepID=UPI001331DFAB|nr:hypothetical protein UNDKW_1233 [Undibacterium sp. KW1]